MDQPNLAAAFESLEQTIAAAHVPSKFTFEIIREVTCDKIATSDLVSADGDTESLWRQLTQKIFDATGFVYRSRADGSEVIEQIPVHFAPVLSAWIKMRDPSPFLSLLKPTADELALLKTIGPVPSTFERFKALLVQINQASADGGDGEEGSIQNSPQARTPTVQLRINRVEGAEQLWQFKPGNDQELGVFVSLQVPGDNDWNFGLVETQSLISRIATPRPDEGYHFTSPEILEIALNAEQGSSKAQWFLASEYELALKNLRDHLSDFLPILNAEKTNAAFAYLNRRLTRVTDFRAKVFDNLQREKIYRKRIAVSRKKYLQDLESRRHLLSQTENITTSAELLNLEPVELAKQNRRVNLVTLFEANLPWESFEPTELRYWKQVLEALKNPVPVEKRKLYFRGLSGDAGEQMVKAVEGSHPKQYVLLPAGWAHGQGSWLFHLHYLQSFLRKTC